MAMTLAKIGRSMKNLDMPPDSYVLNIKKTSGEPESKRILPKYLRLQISTSRKQPMWCWRLALSIGLLGRFVKTPTMVSGAGFGKKRGNIGAVRLELIAATEIPA